MYAVIFSAKVGKVDKHYSEMVNTLRNLAFEQYNCQEFTALTEGENEIAISYWLSLDDIKRWKQNTTHLNAQNLGQKAWYSYYKVQIVEVLKEYELGG